MTTMEVLSSPAETSKEEDGEIALPLELTEAILSRLPAKYLLQFRCVTPSWRALISNPIFINMHIQHCKRNNHHKLMLTSTYCIYSLRCCDQPDNKVLEISHPEINVLYDVEIWGSCNGLVCLTHDVTILCLWNPGTRDYRRVPDSPSHYTRCRYRAKFAYGFGYNWRAEDYQIVKIISEDNFEFTHRSWFCVYSLRKNSWGTIQETAPYVIESHEMGELVNSALHWVGNYSTDRSNHDFVLAYDIVDGMFTEVPLPEGYRNHQGTVKIHVADLHGCLSTICRYTHSVEAWVMKEYNRKESWMKVFRIAECTRDSELMVKSIPLCFTMKCARLMEDTSSRDQFFHRIGSPVAVDLLDQGSTVTTYEESIVSP